MTTASVAGLWKRLTEEDPIGDTVNADRDTTVLWTQSATSGIYVDIRLPKDSPGLSFESAKAFIKRPEALAGGIIDHERLLPHLEVLTRQKSFAGVLDVKMGDTTDGQALAKDVTLKKLVDNNKQAVIPLCVCFWRRDLDYWPPSGGLDVGVCASAADVEDGHLWLRETGDDASYAEDWSRPVETSEGPFMALQLVDDDDNRSGYWVRAADCFAYAVGRPTRAELGPSARVHDCVGKSLGEAAQELAGTDQERLDIIGSYVCVAGRITEQGEWVIQHSLNPELVGCTLVGGKPDLSCGRLDKTSDNGKVVQVIPLPNGKEARRSWKVMELSAGCSLPTLP